MALTIDGTRQKWGLTREAFDAFLAALAPEREEAGRAYLDVRRNLVRLFEWRGCATPEEYADEAINRCAKRLSEGEPIRDVGTYAIGVARMLLREMAHARIREAPLESAPEPRTLPMEMGDAEAKRGDCLRECLAALPAESRELILTYYAGEKSEKIRNRQELSKRLGVPQGTLRMRALRLRATLQACAEGCTARCGKRSL